MPVTMKILALCSVVLFFKMVAIGFYQGTQRKKLNATANPEDAKMLGIECKTEPEPIQRGHRAFRNDVENIPIFLFLALIYGLAGAWETGAYIYFIGFTVARVSHTFCYLNQIQPLRSLSFGIGLLCTTAIAVHIILAVM